MYVCTYTYKRAYVQCEYRTRKQKKKNNNVFFCFDIHLLTVNGWIAKQINKAKKNTPCLLQVFF